MAIYHMSIKIGSKSKGQSAVAAAAYRSGEKLTDQETGLISDYTKKGGVVFSEISLCENAPAEYADRATLWNAVHQIEKNKNAQLWREFEVALPQELSREKQIATVRDFVKQLTARGMCADWSLHDKGDGNPHAHIMTTMRSITEDGKWAAKSRLVYDLDEHGERIFQKVNKQGRKQYKSHKEDYNDWNATERVEEWRAAWAECCNARLAEHDRIDHRSYARQGKKDLPTMHEGYVARQIAKRGGQSTIIDYNKAVRVTNKAEKTIELSLKAIETEIEQFEQELKTLKAQKGQEEQNARRNQINERIRKLRERAGAINADGANTDTERKIESTTDRAISEDTETLIRQARIGIDSATAREKDSTTSRADREAERERQAALRSQQEAERRRAEDERRQQQVRRSKKSLPSL